MDIEEHQPSNELVNISDIEKWKLQYQQLRIWLVHASQQNHETTTWKNCRKAKRHTSATTWLQNKSEKLVNETGGEKDFEATQKNLDNIKKHEMLFQFPTITFGSTANV